MTHYQHVDHRHVLTIGPRHVTPCTDDLIIGVHHTTTGDGGTAVLLEREDVEAMHAWLETWLRDGWPGVPRGAGRLIVTYPDGSRRRIRTDGTEQEPERS
jgi:hypothetical protein